MALPVQLAPAHSPGGFYYTAADCRRWLAEVGFRETSVEHLAGPDSTVVALK